jgi:hypothetical protein
MKVEYPDKFKVGDIAICNKFVCFVDNTYHMIGQEIEVTKDTVSYFNVNYQDYDKG